MSEQTTTPEQEQPKAAKKEFTTSTLGGLWYRESTMTPGTRFLSGLIRLSADENDRNAPSLNVTLHKNESKKTERSFDVRIKANKKDILAYIESLKKYLGPSTTPVTPANEMADELL